MNITSANYHDMATKREYMSHSQYRNWLTCAAATRAEIFDGYQPRKTDALIVGGYVDRALTAPEELMAYIEQYKDDIYGKKGGKLAAFVKADMLIDRLEKDATWQTIAKASKKQVVMQGVIAGVNWLYMSDLQIERNGQETVIDLKTACDFEEDWVKDCAGRSVKVNWIDAAGYWRQLAVGKELFRQTHKAEAVCAIIGAKKPVTDDRPVGLGLWVLDDATRLSEEIRQIERMTPLVMSWKDGSVPAPACGKCDYCLSKSSLDVEQVAVSQRDYTV
jgi:hypothetical protein